jgi:predicted nucleotidyltransferase component of viral defense system
MIKAISVKDRLKQKAIDEGKTMQDLLVSFGLERTIYRLSISKYADKFTLKGGIFLYALFSGEYARATTDVNLLAKNISNDSDKMKEIFMEIFSIDCDDALQFDLSSLKVVNITEFKKYHGANVSVMGYLDRTRIPVSIDIGFDDVIYPDRIKMDFPVLLDMDIPSIYVYSVYSVIAEKFEAFVSLGLANGRYKDFYDIFVLANSYKLNGEDLKNAVIETFEHRGTEFEDIAAFAPDFTEDITRQNRWKAFIKKKKVLVQVDFEEVIALVRELLIPIEEAIVTRTCFNKKWDNELKRWIPI